MGKRTQLFGVACVYSRMPPLLSVRPSATKIVSPSGLIANWFDVGKLLNTSLTFGKF